MVIPPTPHYSNVLVPVSRGSVVPGLGDLDIFFFYEGKGTLGKVDLVLYYLMS